MSPHPFDALSLEQLRQRQSAKWQLFPADVLPMWVAEMDYPLAPEITQRLAEALEAGDTGYAMGGALASAYSVWVEKQWGWKLSPAHVTPVGDVMSGVKELLNVGTRPGDRVVISPPVYPPFGYTVTDLGRELVKTPLLWDENGRASLDFNAIEDAFRAGAKAYLLCSPENPAGIVHSRETLVQLAELADRYGVLVLSDEIHAPLTLPGATHTPFVTASEKAAARGIVVASASKTWNLAGLKAAMMVATSPTAREVLGRVFPTIGNHVGHWGVLAGEAAFSKASAWHADLLTILDRNRKLLASLLAEHLPDARYRPPDAGYLAWVDLRAYGLGDAPADVLLKEGKVAFFSGVNFGDEGKGFVRINYATSAELLEEGVRRMAKVCNAQKKR